MCRILKELSLSHRYIDPIDNSEGNNIIRSKTYLETTAFDQIASGVIM